MSKTLNLNLISEEHKEQILKDLQIRIEGSSFSFNTSSRYIYPIDIWNSIAYIPFAYGRNCPSGLIPPPGRKNYTEISCLFNGSLREEQKIVKKEAISHLNKFGSTIIQHFPDLENLVQHYILLLKLN